MSAAASAMSSRRPSLRILETTVVAPPTSLPECSLPLTFYDVFWVNAPPVEHVFLYRLADGDDTAAILCKLKESLSYAVLAYYLLAGRLRLSTTNRYELHYRPGDGVTFTVAECDGVDVDELATDEPREVARIAPLVPPLPTGGAVLAIQATVVRGGLAIGFALHHAACDGASSSRFRHAWSAASTGTVGPPPPPLVLDRSLVQDARLYDTFLGAAMSGDEMDRVGVSHDNLLATFTVTGSDLQRIKAVVAGEATRISEAPPPPRRCSSLVAAVGFIWSCHQQAKDGASNGDPTYIILPVDHRSRRKPPVPAEYFGNCIGAGMHGAPKDELAATGGLFTACTAVAAAIEEAVADMDFSRDRVRQAAAAGGVLAVAGSPRFRVYEVDLGFGRPAKVDIVSVARTGAMAVVESRSSDGGVEVSVSLPVAGMKRFQKCFADAIAFLRST